MEKIKLPAINPKRTALLVIDMQNDFTEKGAIFEIPNIRKKFPDIKKFIDNCRKNGMLVIYTRHNCSPSRNPIESRLFPELKERGLRKGSHGVAINDYLKPEKTDIVLDKNRYDAFYKTKLEKILKSKNITELIIIGAMTNVCCESTARAAMYRDYNIWFISDLNFTFDKKKHNYTLKTIQTHFGRVANSKNIFNNLTS